MREGFFFFLIYRNSLIVIKFTIFVFFVFFKKKKKKTGTERVLHSFFILLRSLFILTCKLITSLYYLSQASMDVHILQFIHIYRLSFEYSNLGLRTGGFKGSMDPTL